MNNSKPGQKLDPALKAIIDPVYSHDPKRYARLIQWVWACQKAGWSDEVIGQAILLAKNTLHVVNNWWGLLDSLLPKASGRAHEDESTRYKNEEKNFLDALLNHLRGRQV